VPFTGPRSAASAGSPSRRTSMSRRHLLAAGIAIAGGLATSPALAEGVVRIGLTPVLLDSDMLLLRALDEYFRDRLDRPVELVRRRTYQEISMMLLSGQLDAAWICGFPYVQYRDQLALVAVPVYLGKPLYQSYVIVNDHNPTQRFDDLRGQVHAFSDPDSNSGFLVTRALLAEMGERPDTFFHYHFFTYGHRNVIRAVAAGLAESGSVDGYVYDVVRATEPDVVENTRVIRRSEWLGFPPIACHQSVRGTALVEGIAAAFLSMDRDEMGQEILEMLHLDGFAPGEPSLFDGIAAKYELVRRTA
jgi:phosphonate transport system substrate-binding protein